MRTDWKETCKACMDGDIEPRHCEYYGEPNGCNSPTYGEHPPVGNAAALREALEFVHDKLLTWNYTDKDTAKMAVVLVDKCSKALAAPPRNCDRFRNKEEAEIEFMMSDGLPRDNGDTKMRAWMCRFIDWLLAPAAERKGE